MPTLMGGSGSTGSSLLRTILNRHPTLFSGEELNFFNKEQVFDDWERSRRRVFCSRLFPPFATRGWFSWPGTQLTHADYGWSIAELGLLFERVSGVKEFADVFFSRPLGRTGSDDWVEKTPSNSYSFRQFLRDFDDGKVVHTTRDPLASVASLVYRGMDPFYAAGLWLYNTAAALVVEGDPRCHTVRYEDLTEEPHSTVERLCSFLGTTYSPELLTPKEPDKVPHARNPGWAHARTDPVTANVSRFDALSTRVQHEIRVALSLLEVSPAHASEKGLSATSCAPIASRIGYAFEPVSRPSRQDVVSLERALLRDRWHRIKRRYPTGLRYYPLWVRRV
jgi:hypothetical protein